jgi:DNA-binding NtrC family response regulator
MRLLIVGSLEGHIATAGKIALERGAKVAHVDDIEGTLTALRSGQGADLVMVDVKLDIARLCTSLTSERICVPVVACGIGASPEIAAEAIRAGAKEYVPLPPDAELIAAVLEAVAEESNALIFRDPAMNRVLRLATQVATSDASVLITGESGTGKEIMARYIHAKSKRADRSFISVNCAAIPESLLESELFGHEKGAFTGAVSRRLGKFEEANRGTLLLDEISEMHPRLQAKLLRAVQEREIDRVGGSQPIKVDIRLLATSNRDLEEEVRQGNFREDLYLHFIKKYAEANGVASPALAPRALDRLQRHHWRGNVRELENAMHRAVLLVEGDIIEPELILLSGRNFGPEGNGDSRPTEQVDGADGNGNGAENAALVGRTVADVERHLILETLNHCLGNRTHAANILGISIRTLRNKLKLYSQDGVSVPMPGEGERQAL